MDVLVKVLRGSLGCDLGCGDNGAHRSWLYECNPHSIKFCDFCESELCRTFSGHLVIFVFL